MPSSQFCVIWAFSKDFSGVQVANREMRIGQIKDEVREFSWSTEFPLEGRERGKG